VVVGRHGLTPEQAFLRLSEHAARHDPTVAEEQTARAAAAKRLRLKVAPERRTI
jgi:hypothetical protein